METQAHLKDKRHPVLEEVVLDIKNKIAQQGKRTKRLYLPLPEDGRFDEEVRKAAEVVCALRKLKPAPWENAPLEVKRKILAGERSSLVMPQAHIDEWKKNAGDAPMDDENVKAEGYQLAWGHLIEDIYVDGDGKHIAWEIRFDSLSAEFFAAGGNMVELEDCAIDEMSNLLAIRTNNCEAHGLYFYEGGNLDSTCLRFSLASPDAEQKARRWICDRLLDGKRPILQVLIERLRHINRGALPDIVKFYLARPRPAKRRKKGAGSNVRL